MTTTTDPRRMPPIVHGGPLHREWRSRVAALEGYGMSSAEAEVWAAEDLGLLPLASEVY